MAGRAATRPPIPSTHVAALPRSLRARFRARKPHHPPSCRSPARRARSQQPAAHPRPMARHSALAKPHRVGLGHLRSPLCWPAPFPGPDDCFSVWGGFTIQGGVRGCLGVGGGGGSEGVRGGEAPPTGGNFLLANPTTSSSGASKLATQRSWGGGGARGPLGKLAYGRSAGGTEGKGKGIFLGGGPTRRRRQKIKLPIQVSPTDLEQPARPRPEGSPSTVVPAALTDSARRARAPANSVSASALRGRGSMGGVRLSPAAAKQKPLFRPDE